MSQICLSPIIPDRPSEQSKSRSDFAQLHILDLNIEVSPIAKGLGDDVPEGMHPGFRRGENTVRHLLGHPTVVPGDLPDALWAQQVGPAVPHMGQGYLWIHAADLPPR